MSVNNSTDDLSTHVRNKSTIIYIRTHNFKSIQHERNVCDDLPFDANDKLTYFHSSSFVSTRAKILMQREILLYVAVIKHKMTIAITVVVKKKKKNEIRAVRCQRRCDLC